MEFDIQHFTEQYKIYEDYRESDLGTHFENLDVKLRLAFGIKEIILNDRFVLPKSDELKECHKLYYKLTDLWFAYEAFIKFHDEKIIEPKIGKDKTTWLGDDSQTKYKPDAKVLASLASANVKFQDEYALNDGKKEFFISYFKYCEGQVPKNHKCQKARLSAIVEMVETNNLNFTNTDLLTMTYAVRNNFAHNGETTIAPVNFNYAKKLVLLKILYEYLAVVLLTSINVTCSSVINNGEVNGLTC